MKITVPIFTIALLVSLFVEPLIAQKEADLNPAEIDTLFLHDEIIVTAQRFEDRAFDRPEVISTLNAADLMLLTPMSTPDALSFLPGVWMQKTNHGGGSPFIRGLTGYQTLILIDGIRFNNATFRSGPNQYLNTIDPYTLHRVEVMKGQGSVQYGSDAIGGVINLMTYSPGFSEGKTTVDSRVYAKGMSDDMEYTGRVALDIAGEKFAVSGGVTYKKLGDIQAGGQKGRLTPTNYRENALDLKSKFKLGGAQVLTVGGQFLRQAEVPLYHQLISGEFQTYLFDPQQRSMAYAKWETSLNSKLFSQLRVVLSNQQSLEKRKKQKTGDDLFAEETDRVNTTGISFEWISQPTAFWKISSGMEGYFDQISSNTIVTDVRTSEQQSQRGLYPDQSKGSNMAVFSQHTFQLKRFNVTTGVRFNSVRLSLEDDLFGESVIKPTAIVGNLGLVHKLSKNFRLIASMNSAFRAPNINDVSSFGLADFRYEIPNYDLKPEKSRNLELGLKFKNNKSSLGLSAFHNKLKDLIANVPGSYNGMDSIDGVKVYQRENINKAVIKGIEAEWFHAFNQKIGTFGFIGYTFGQNISADEPMRRIPPLNGRIGIKYQLKQQWQVRVDWIFAAEQSRLSGGDIADDRIALGGTPGWNTANLLLAYQKKFFVIDIGMQNIFNEAYRTHGSGVDGVGRSLWVAIKIYIGSGRNLALSD